MSLTIFVVSLVTHTSTADIIPCHSQVLTADSRALTVLNGAGKSRLQSIVDPVSHEGVRNDRIIMGGDISHQQRIYCLNTISMCDPKLLLALQRRLSRILLKNKNIH